MSELDDDFRLLVQGHLEGTLSRAERVRLQQRVHGDALLREAFRAQVRESLRCAAWFASTDGEATARRVVALIARDHSADATATSVRVRERIARRRRNRVAAWMVAAAVLLTLGLMMLDRSVSGSEAMLDDATAGVRLLRDGIAVADGSLHAGDDLIGGVGDGATIRYPDGTRVHAIGPCRVRIAGGPGGKHLVVAHGQFDVEVAPQPAQRPFTMATASARIEVVGTAFRLAADERATALEVRSGSVRFARAREPAMIAVPAGHGVVSDDLGPLAARALPSPPAGLQPARRFDFENGTRPPETHLGIIDPGPPRLGSRWCLAAEPNPDHPGSVLVWLMDFEEGLFAVGTDTEISWDYWLGDDAASLSLWLYDQEQQASYRVAVEGVVPRRWTSVTIKLSELTQDTGSTPLAGPELGDRITSLHVSADAGGVLFIDNLRVSHR